MWLLPADGTGCGLNIETVKNTNDCDMCRKPVPRWRKDNVCSTQCWAKYQDTKPKPMPRVFIDDTLSLNAATVASADGVVAAPEAMTRPCEHCGGPIPTDKSHAALTCSDRCYTERKLALERRRHHGPKNDAPGYKPKPCVGCGDTFTPTANANRYCDVCKLGGAKPATAPNNRTLPVSAPTHEVQKGEARAAPQIDITDIDARGIDGGEPHMSEAEPAGTTEPALSGYSFVSVADDHVCQCGMSMVVLSQFGCDESRQCALCDFAGPERMALLRRVREAVPSTPLKERTQSAAAEAAFATPAEILNAAGFTVRWSGKVPAGDAVLVVVEGPSK